MNLTAIKTLVAYIIKETMGKKKIANAEKIIASVDDRPDGILIYLSHGATLGEAMEIQEKIKEAGLKIPEQMGNAVIYVTAN